MVARESNDGLIALWATLSERQNVGCCEPCYNGDHETLEDHGWCDCACHAMDLSGVIN